MTLFADRLRIAQLIDIVALSDMKRCLIDVGLIDVKRCLTDVTVIKDMPD